MLARIKCMIGSKQTHTFARKSGQFVERRVHGIKEMKYDIEFGIDELKIDK